MIALSQMRAPAFEGTLTMTCQDAALPARLCRPPPCCRPPRGAQDDPDALAAATQQLDSGMALARRQIARLRPAGRARHARAGAVRPSRGRPAAPPLRLVAVPPRRPPGRRARAGPARRQADRRFGLGRGRRRLRTGAAAGAAEEGEEAMSSRAFVRQGRRGRGAPRASPPRRSSPRRSGSMRRSATRW